MPGAVIAIDQDRPAGTSFGNPGIARKDLWLTRTVRPRCTTSGNTSFLWSLEDVPPGSSSTITTGTETQSSCDFDPDSDGSYRLKLITNGGGPGNVQILICAVTRDQNGNLLERGWRIPALGEQGTEGNFGGQTRGWDESVREIFDDIRTNAFTGGPTPSGSGADDGAALRAVNFSTRTSRPALLATDLATGSVAVSGVALVDSAGDLQGRPLLYYVTSSLESTGLKRVDVLTGQQSNVFGLDEGGPLFSHGNMLLVVGETVCYINQAPDAETLYTISSPGTGFDGLATVGVASATGTAYWFITSPDDNNVYRVALNPGGSVVADTALTGVPNPYGIATDDAGNIWIAFPDDNYVQKYTIGPTGTLSASGAPVIAHITSNLVFDGKYIFGLNKGGDFEAAQIVRIAVADGSVMAAVSTYVDSRSFIAFDGARLWFTGSHRTIAFHPETFDVLVNLNGTFGDSHGQIIADSRTGNLFVALPANGGSGRSVLFYSHGHYEALDGLRLRAVNAGQFLRADPDTGEILGADQGVITPLTLTGDSDIVELTIKGAPGQTANFQEWRTSTNSLKAAITAAGTMLLSALSEGGVVHADNTGLLSTSQVIDAEIATVSWSKVTSTPTTLSGYGITDGVRGPPTGDLNTVLGSDGSTNFWTGAPVLSTSLSFAKAGAAPTISQLAQTDDTGCHDFTIQSQTPFASATGTNRNPGNLILTVPAPASGGADGFLKVNISGQQVAAFGQYPGFTPWKALWLGLDAVAPTVTNFVLVSDSGNSPSSSSRTTQLNVPASDGFLALAVAGSAVVRIKTDRMMMALQQAAIFEHQARVTDATVFDFTIRSQAPFATATTNKNPGNLIFDIPAPVSGGATGFVKYTNNGAVVANIGPTTTAAIPAVYLGTAIPDNNNYALAVVNSNGKVLLNSQLSTSLVVLGAHNAGIVSFGRSGTVGASFSQDLAYTIGQDTPTTDTATQVLTIASQAPFASATGTNRNPGNLVLAVPAPAGGGADGFVKTTISGNTRAQIGVYSLDTTYGSVWLGGITPSHFNYAIASNGQYTFLNGTFATAFASNDAVLAYMQPGGLFFLGDVAAAIRFINLATDVHTVDLTIQAQLPYSAGTGTNRDAGNIILNIPTPTSGGSRGLVRFTNDTATVMAVGRRTTNEAAVWIGTVAAAAPTDTNYTIKTNASGSTVQINASSAGSIGFIYAGINTMAIIQNFSGANHLSFGFDQLANIDQTNQASDVPANDMSITTQKGFTSATGTNRNSANLFLQTNIAISGGVPGRIAIRPGLAEAFSVDSTTQYTLFGGPTWTTGSGAPSSSQVDGSRYSRTDSPNGDEFIRHNAAWVSVLNPAAGLFTLPGLVLGGTNQVIWSDGALNQWTAAPILNTSLQVQSGATRTLITNRVSSSTLPAIYMGSTSPTSSNYILTATSTNTILNAPDPTGGVVFFVGGLNVLALTMPVSNTTAILGFWEAQTPTFKINDRTTDSVTHDLTLAGQTPFASATGANRNPGNLLLNIPAPVSGGSDAFVKVQRGGTTHTQFGPYPGLPSFGTLWLGAAAPTSTNYALTGNATLTNINGASGTGLGVSLSIDGSPVIAAHAGVFQFWSALANPQLGHEARTSDAATTDLTIQSQAPFASATGSNRNPGNLVLAIPAFVAGGTASFVKIASSATTLFQIGESPSGVALGGKFYAGSVTPSALNYAFSLSPTSDLVILNATTGAASPEIKFQIDALKIMSWFSDRAEFGMSMTAPRLTVGTRTTDAVTHDLTIASQAPFASATGSNRNSGGLLLESPAPVSGGVAGRVALRPGQADALAADTSTHLTMFGGPTWTTGTAAPSSSEVDGSQYTRTGSPNGDFHIRHNAAWVSVLNPAAGLFTLPGLVLGGTNQVIWSDGALNQWTASPIVGTSLQINTGAAKSFFNNFGGLGAGLYMGNVAPDFTNFALAQYVVSGVSILQVSAAGSTGIVGIGPNGSSTFYVKNDRFQFVNVQAGLLEHEGRTGDQATANLTLQSQAPYASATGTNVLPGNLVFSVPAPASGTTHGYVKTVISAVENHRWGYSASFLGTNGATLYAGLGADAPASSNYVLAIIGASGVATSTVQINVPYAVGTGSVTSSFGVLTVAGTQVFKWKSDRVQMNLAQAALFEHQPRATDAACFDFTIQSQTPFASATGTNRNPGNLILAVAAPASGGADGFAKVSISGSTKFQFGTNTANGGNWSSIWLGAGITPSTTNYAITADGGIGLFLNGTSADGFVGFGANNSPIAYFTKTTTITGVAGLTFETGQAYTIGQRALSSDAATSDLTIQPQAPFASATGTNRNPGNVVVNIPAAASGGVQGFTKFSFGGSVKAWFGATSVASSVGVFYLGTATPVMPAGAGVGNYALQGDGSTIIGLNAPAASASILFTVANNTRWTITDTVMRATSLQAAEIQHNQRASDAVCFDFTIRSQTPFATATGANRNPGNLVLVIPSPVSGGSRGYVTYTNDGATVLQVGRRTTGDSALWMGGVTPSDTNYAIYSTGAYTVINSPTTAAVGFSTADVTMATIQQFSGATHLQFSQTMAAEINFVVQASDIPVNDLTIRSQKAFGSATGTNRNSGNINYDIEAPRAGGSYGFHKFTFAAALVLSLAQTGTLEWATTVTPTLRGADDATAGGTAKDFTVQAPNATGTGTTTGGNVVVQTGTGTSPGSFVMKMGANTLGIWNWNTGYTYFQAGSSASAFQFLANTAGGQYLRFISNGPTFFAADEILFQSTAGTTKGYWTNTGFRVGDAVAATEKLEVAGNLAFASTVTPILYQLGTAGVGAALTIRAQASTGDDAGALNLLGGTSTSSDSTAGGDVNVTAGSSLAGDGSGGNVSISAGIGSGNGDGSIFLSTGGTGGFMYYAIGGTTRYTFDSGALTLAVVNLTFAANQSSPLVKQATQTSNTATFDLTLQSQAPFASATGSNRNPGNLVYAVPSPAAGGATGKHSFKVSGTERLSISATAVTVALLASAGVVHTDGSGVLSTSAIVNADVSTSAAITGNKLSFLNSTYTTTGTIAATDVTVLINFSVSELSLTMPAAADGKMLIVKNIGSVSVSLSRAGSDDFYDGASSHSTSMTVSPTEGYILIGRAGHWSVVASYNENLFLT